MGNCECAQGASEEGNINTNIRTTPEPQSVVLEGRLFTITQIWNLIRIQSTFHMYMAKRRVQAIKTEMMDTPGMMSRG